MTYCVGMLLDEGLVMAAEAEPDAVSEVAEGAEVAEVAEPAEAPNLLQAVADMIHQHNDD